MPTIAITQTVISIYIIIILILIMAACKTEDSFEHFHRWLMSYCHCNLRNRGVVPRELDTHSDSLTYNSGRLPNSVQIKNINKTSDSTSLNYCNKYGKLADTDSENETHKMQARDSNSSDSEISCDKIVDNDGIEGHGDREDLQLGLSIPANTNSTDESGSNLETESNTDFMEEFDANFTKEDIDSLIQILSNQNQLEYEDLKPSLLHHNDSECDSPRSRKQTSHIEEAAVTNPQPAHHNQRNSTSTANLDRNGCDDNHNTDLSVCLCTSGLVQQPHQQPHQPPQQQPHQHYHQQFQQPASCGQKRKPDDSITENVAAQFNHNSNLLQITLTKILTPPSKRIEPSLKKFMFLKSLMKQLQYGLSLQTPCKKINLDLCHPDVEMINESTALHNLHLTANSVSTPLPLAPCTSLDCDLFIPTLQSPPPTANPLLAPSDTTVDTTRKTDSNFNNCCGYPTSYTKEQQSDMEDNVEQSDMSMEVCQSSTVLNVPTEIVDNTMIPSFENMDFQSLVQCSIDQLSPKERVGASGAVAKPHPVDELDSIMQVLVGM